MQLYEPEELKVLIDYSRNLPEKSYRHFLALQYKRFGYGSQRYISKVFKCSRRTILRGYKELDGIEPISYTTQRNKGGGRKKKFGN